MHIYSLPAGAQRVRLVPEEAPSPNAPYAIAVVPDMRWVFEREELALDSIRLHNAGLITDAAKRADYLGKLPAWAYNAAREGWPVFHAGRWFVLAHPQSVVCCDGAHPFAWAPLSVVR